MTPGEPGNVRPTLLVLNSDFRGREFILSGRSARIGRSRECEIQMDLASISRHHAIVEEVDGRFYVRDLGSRNGIRVGDRPVTQAELCDGEEITVGEVLLRFQCAAPAASAAQPADSAIARPSPAAGVIEAAPSAERPLTALDILAAARTDRASELPAEQRVEAATGPAVGLNIKLVAAFVLALVLSSVVGGLILWQKGRQASKRDEVAIEVLVKAGGNQWLSCKGLIPDFSNEEIQIEDETVAEARRYDQGELLITAKAGGATNVEIASRTGKRFRVRVIVRDRVEDPLEELTYGRFSSADERWRMGRGFVETGRLLEDTEPYLALQEYRKAEAVLKPLGAKAALFLASRVANRINAASRAVKEQWDKLSADIGVALRNDERTRAQELLDEALGLIPDPNDPRHQKAAAKKQQLIDDSLKMQRRKRRGRS